MNVAGVEDLRVAMAAYEAAGRHWPETITLRQGRSSPRGIGMIFRPSRSRMGSEELYARSAKIGHATISCIQNVQSRS
jgi:hypothetical protein